MRVYATLLTLAVIAFPFDALPQQNLTPDDIVSSLGGGQQPSPSDALSKESIVSSLGGAPAPTGTAAGKEFFKELQQTKRTRSFTIKERDEVENFSVSRPKVSIEVYFDYNSSEITSPAKATLDKLGLALQDPRLARKNFIFRGHTDAKGNENYNLQLSDRRAEAVKRYIVRTFGVVDHTILSIGNGARNLKNPDNPFADENRRVEVVRSD